MPTNEPQDSEEDASDIEYISDCNDCDDSFVFFKTKKPNPLDDTVVSVRAEQEEIEKELGIPDKWINVPAAVKAYVDDLNIIEKIRHSDAVSHITQDKQCCMAHAPQSQCIFKQLCSRTDEMSMKVNEQKTQVLCISAAKTAHVTSFINTKSSRIKSGKELKILGFWFNERPTVDLHFEKMIKKFRGRLWTLRHLRRAGMSKEDLLFIYKSVIRPVFDFASVAYHTMIGCVQEETLEILQRRALKIIFGTENSTKDLMAKSGLPTLIDRRERLFTNFALKAKNNPRVNKKWFPPAMNSRHEIRQTRTIQEFTARTDRLYRSPLFQLRKRINDHA